LMPPEQVRVIRVIRVRSCCCEAVPTSMPGPPPWTAVDSARWANTRPV